MLLGNSLVGFFFFLLLDFWFNKLPLDRVSLN